MEDGPPVFSPDSSCPLILWIPLTLLLISPTRLSLPLVGFPKPFGYDLPVYVAVRNPDCISTTGLASSAFARHYLRNLFDFFSSGYLDVSVPRVPHVYLWIQYTFHGSSPWGFPHSEICGSKLICSSPQLIAACHVLRRLLMPRHSPYALLRLN